MKKKTNRAVTNPGNELQVTEHFLLVINLSSLKLVYYQEEKDR